MDLKKRMTLGIFGAAALATMVGATAAQAFKPNKPIDFVIMAGKGGGADKMARLMQSIIEKEKLSPRPLVPVNKSGGSGAEALVHMKGARDPNHTIECDVLVSGDDPAAREAVIELVEAANMHGWHAGPIDNAVVAEALTSVLIHMNRRYKIAGAGIRVTGDSKAESK